MAKNTPKSWKPDGPYILITQLVEGKPTRKKFYGVEAREKFLETIAYFVNEADRDLFLSTPARLAAADALVKRANGAILAMSAAQTYIEENRGGLSNDTTRRLQMVIDMLEAALREWEAGNG